MGRAALLVTAACACLAITVASIAVESRYVRSVAARLLAADGSGQGGGSQPRQLRLHVEVEVPLELDYLVKMSSLQFSNSEQGNYLKMTRRQLLALPPGKVLL